MTIAQIMSLTDESDKNVSFEPEGTDGDDERTEPERSPSPLLALRQQNSAVTERGGGRRGRNKRKYTDPQDNDSKKSPEPITRSNNARLKRNYSNGVHKNHGGAVKKRRRGKKRHNKKKWKPYTELTWEERKAVDERESARAAKKRENRPTPYNTTQFLMEDHKVETPDFSSVAMLKNNLESSDDPFDDDNVGGFLEKDFSAVYDDFQSERLQNMSKVDLISEVLALSSKVNELEGNQKLNSHISTHCNGNLDMQQISPEVHARLQSVGVLETTVSKLREENLKLQSENHRLVSFSMN